jgi:hypothetical protein
MCKAADQGTLRLAKPTVDDILTNHDEHQLAGIRQSVLSGLGSIAKGHFIEYDGREGLKDLAASVRAKGRKALKRR